MSLSSAFKALRERGYNVAVSSGGLRLPGLDADDAVDVAGIVRAHGCAAAVDNDGVVVSRAPTDLARWRADIAAKKAWSEELWEDLDLAISEVMSAMARGDRERAIEAAKEALAAEEALSGDYKVTDALLSALGISPEEAF